MSADIPRVRVSPSALDGWDYFQDQDDRSEEALRAYVAQLTGERPPTAAMQRGTDFHKALETYFAGPNKGEWQCEIELPPKSTWKLLLPAEVEVKREKKKLRTILRGRIDALHKPERGEPVIIDYKTTERGIDLLKYAESWQWRAYLLLWPEVDQFRYDCFQLREQGRNSGLYYVADHSYISLQRYEGMEAETWGKIEELADFIRAVYWKGWLEIDKDGRPVPLGKGGV